MPRGGGGAGGGHGPRAQALELVGANFKKKIRPRQISKVTSLQWPAKVAYHAIWAPRSLCIRGSFYFFVLKTFFLFIYFFFCLSFFFLRGGCRIYQGGRTPSPKGASRVGLCGGGGAPIQALTPGRWRPSVRHWLNPTPFSKIRP